MSPGSAWTARVSEGRLLSQLAADPIEHVEHPPGGGVKAVLEQCQRMMGIGQHVGFATQIVKGCAAEARQDLGEENLESLFRHRQARRQGRDAGLDLGASTSGSSERNACQAGSGTLLEATRSFMPAHRKRT